MTEITYYWLNVEHPNWLVLKLHISIILEMAVWLKIKAATLRVERQNINSYGKLEIKIVRYAGARKI